MASREAVLRKKLRLPVGLIARVEGPRKVVAGRAKTSDAKGAKGARKVRQGGPAVKSSNAMGAMFKRDVRNVRGLKRDVKVVVKKVRKKVAA